MKKSFATLVLIIIGLVSFAQQDAQFSHNMFNRLTTNPGYAGTNRAICATTLYRQQWVSFPGAPKTGLLSIDAYIPVIKGGLGLTVMNDQLGFDKSNFAKLAYSFHLPIGAGTLGIGAEVGMIQKSINGIWMAPDGSKGEFDQAIPLSGSTVSKTTYDLGFGAYYVTNQLYFGLSSSHLTENPLSFTDPKKKLGYQLARHYYVTAGYDYAVTPTIDLKPSIFIKSDASSTQLDVNVLAQWNKLVWGGVSYRLTDALVALVGLNYGLANGSNLRFGYSYDITTSSMKAHSNGSHEIMLGYCFKVSPPDKMQSHKNVRFM